VRVQGWVEQSSDFDAAVRGPRPLAPAPEARHDPSVSDGRLHLSSSSPLIVLVLAPRDDMATTSTSVSAKTDEDEQRMPPIPRIRGQ
jgi:hypothetical protein